MPRRNKISQLPEAVRAQLEQALIAANFSGYGALADWLKSQGIDVSRSALHRYGSDFEARIAAIKRATDQARAVVQASPDDDNAVNDALIRLVQERVFSVLVESQGGNIEVPLLGKISKAIADLGRASVQQKKFQVEFRDRLAKTLADKAAAAERGGEKTRAEVYREIREEVYGLA
ncbi:MAG: DUF3486 family protein [Betaproteobacteria bacterium]|nr:DUF3486 family protein [Betaproteobacteria bacterium]